jgi:hypothetical protein
MRALVLPIRARASGWRPSSTRWWASRPSARPAPPWRRPRLAGVRHSAAGRVGARWRARLDRVLVVDCPPARRSRVMARSGLPREQVQAIIDAQAARTQRLAAADWVLFNGDGVTVGELQAQINVLAQGFGL